MDLPLEIWTRNGRLYVDRPQDNSTTRLMVTLAHLTLELDVQDVRDLAGALLQWLSENDHDLPDLPARDEDVQPVDEDDSSRPPGDEAGWGNLVVARDRDGVRIDQADPWVRASGELLDEMAHRDTAWCTVRGLVLELRDDAGRSCRYVVRPDVGTPSGTVALQRTQELLPAVTVVPEHTRSWPLLNHRG